jgi:hypothetical protein
LVAQPLGELPELRKLNHRLVAVHAYNKLGCFGSWRNGCVTIAMLHPSQRDMPMDKLNATVGEVKTKL